MAIIFVHPSCRRDVRRGNRVEIFGQVIYPETRYLFLKFRIFVEELDAIWRKNFRSRFLGIPSLTENLRHSPIVYT